MQFRAKVMNPDQKSPFILFEIVTDIEAGSRKILFAISFFIPLILL